MMYKVSLLLGTYWNSFTGAMMETEKKVHNIMNKYYTMTVPAATPQYGFAKRLNLFGKKGIEATYKELKNYLLCPNAVPG